MPMFAWCADIAARLRAVFICRRGSAGIEAALIIPVFLLTFSGLLELGRAFEQAHAVEKGLRSGALYLARADNPQASASQTVARNLVMTGRADGGEPYLAPGWAAGGASVDITVSTFMVSGSPTPVVEIEAAVPFAPLMPVLAAAFGVDGYTIRLSHQQAYVGT